MLKYAAQLLLALCFVAAAPAQAALIASYTSGTGLLCGGCTQPDPTVTPQYTAVSVFGTSVHNVSPTNDGDIFVIDLGGATLAQVATWFTDGVDDPTPAWLELQIGYSGGAWSMVTIGEDPATIGDFGIGQTIDAVRITLDEICFDIRDGNNNCNNDPQGNRVGFTMRYTVEFFDAAIAVPTPASGALAVLALALAAATTRRRR